MYVRIVEDGYNLFCIRFRVRKVRGARVSRRSAGLCVSESAWFSLDENLSRRGDVRTRYGAAAAAAARFSHYYVRAVTSRVKY